MWYFFECLTATCKTQVQIPTDWLKFRPDTKPVLPCKEIVGTIEREQNHVCCHEFLEARLG